MIQIAIPSKGRANCVETLKLFDDLSNVTIFVNDEKEKAEYESHNRCKVVSLGTKGIAAARNGILNYFGKGAEVLQLCDDIKAVSYKDDRTPHSDKPLTNAQLKTFIDNGFRICKEQGAHMWGMHCCGSGGIFLQHKIKFKHFIIGTFSGYIVDDIRCDERMILKEDYDFTVKHIKKYGKVVRFDGLHPQARHYTNAGGAVDVRNSETEQFSIGILKELHPDHFIDNKKRPNEVLMRIKAKLSERGIAYQTARLLQENATTK